MSETEDLSVYQRFFELSLNLLCVAGTDGYFKKINPAFEHVLGWSREELLTRPFLEFVHPGDISSTRKEMEKLSHGESTISFSNRYRTKNGSYIWLNWTCYPDQETDQLFAVAHNISELKDLNSRLQDLIHYKDIFLANMSHEIRTPMNAVIGFTDLLRQTLLTDEQKDYVSTIHVASQSLLVIINDILDYAKMEAGKIELEQNPIQLKKVILEASKLCEQRIRDKGLDFVLDLDYKIPDFVLGDSVRLTQILVNLLNNATKFTKTGRVELLVKVARTNANYVVMDFHVRDTGIGIPKERLNRIFERFEQGLVTVSREYGGTGLGLSIVQMLVDLHKGKLEVKSQEGQGSDFSFSIPYSRVKRSTPIPQDRVVNKRPLDALKGLRVLLAEDNPMNLKLALKILHDQKATVETALDGAEAIEKLRSMEFDIILMDLHMPRLNGKEATITIRKELRLTVPIIACTADSLAGEKEELFEIGMDGYILKPYTEKRLVQQILDLVPAIEA